MAIERRQLLVPLDRGRHPASSGSVWLQHRSAAGRRRWVTRVLWSVLAISLIVGADVLLGTPRAGEIRHMSRMPEATKVFDVHGRLAFTVFKERRMAVPLAEVSPHVVKAVIAIEDQRFYRHRGVDLWRIGGAMVANLRDGRKTQGASTITQQLARKSFLTDDKTIRRKVKEAFLAARIEEQFTKDEILELYLNKIYFGNGYYGIEAAARGYFNKTAKTLALDEAALLAGLIQAPSAYEPTDHLERATARRATVLRQMVVAGFIDESTAARLEKEPVGLANGFGHERSGQYFKNHIVRELVDRFGWEMLSQGGLRVYSTIDINVQEAAEAAIAAGLDTTERMPAFRHPKRGDPKTVSDKHSPTYLQGALVAIDPSNGEVRAMTGGRNFDESQFNRALQGKRQAGSAFKPFVFAAAIESGFTPATLVIGLDTPMMAADGAWLPDDGHSTATAMTIRAALKSSSNRAAVQVLRAVGIPRAVSYANRLGLEAPSVPSLVLGAGEVSVLEMASAYGVFANGGWLRTPVFIRRVEDNQGRVLYAGEPHASRAVSEETAFLMADMLSGVVNGGTGYRAREAGFKFRAAGKTGTTNDYRDAWFIGFTPSLVTSVWVGFDQPRTIVPGGYAGQLAAPIWGRFMQRAAGQRDAGWIRRPSGIVAVEVCRSSGDLATEGCRRSISISTEGEIVDQSGVGFEYFRRGTEPLQECPIHGYSIPVNRWRSVIGGDRSSATPGTARAPQPPAAPVSQSGPRVVDVKPTLGPDESRTTEPVKTQGFWGKLKRALRGSSGPDKPKSPPPAAGGSD